MANIKTLKDKNGNIAYPQTHAQAVSMDSEMTLDVLNRQLLRAGDPTVIEDTELPTFPIATETSIGGIKVGSGLDIDEQGVLSALIMPESDPTVPAWAKNELKPEYSYNEIKNTPQLASVALTGDYNDLSSTPNDLPLTGGTMTGDISMTGGIAIKNATYNQSKITMLNNGDIKTEAPCDTNGTAAVIVGKTGIELVNGTTTVLKATDKITSTVNLDMMQHTISNVAEPIANDQCVNKGYVDRNTPKTPQDVGAMPASNVINSFWKGTQEEYDALTSKNPMTLYITTN